jgi:uncharacterized protein with HEPN domain
MDRALVSRMIAALEVIGDPDGLGAADDPLPEGVAEAVRQLGSAARAVSGRLRHRRPEVPWGRLGDLGERMSPGYGPADVAAVRAFARGDVPLLDMQLRSVLGALAF